MMHLAERSQKRATHKGKFTYNNFLILFTVVCDREKDIYFIIFSIGCKFTDRILYPPPTHAHLYYCKKK